MPVIDRAGDMIAVFDVDSEQHAAFDGVDKEHLEAILADVFGH